METVRKKLTYKEWVEVPPELKELAWDAVDGKLPLESLILKALKRQNMKYLVAVSRLYPRETLEIAEKYKNELHKGVVYWVKKLTKENI